MSNNFKVWIDYGAFSAVMKSKGMKEACYQEARRIADTNSDFRATSYVGGKRAGANVWDNSGVLDNKLLKAVR